MKRLLLTTFILLFSPLTFGEAFLSCEGQESDFLPMPSLDVLGLKEIATNSGIHQPNVIPLETAALYGEDTRAIADLSLYPYSAIGKILVETTRIDSNGEKFTETKSCTANLISNCHIITASHCYEPALEDGIISKATFTDSKGREYLVKNSSRSDFNEETPHSPDFAFATLKTNNAPQPGSDLGFFGVFSAGTNSLSNKEIFHVAGHSIDVDKGDSLSVDFDAQVVHQRRLVGELRLNINSNGDIEDKSRYVKTETGMLHMRADTHKGASGGPVFFIDKNGGAFIVGINSTAILDKEGENYKQINLPAHEEHALALATSSRTFFSKMKKFIRQNSCSN